MPAPHPRHLTASAPHQGQYCDICTAANSNRAHPVSNAIDGTERWWQSPPLSRGLEYNEVNVTLDLGQVGSPPRERWPWGLAGAAGGRPHADGSVAVGTFCVLPAPLPHAGGEEAGGGFPEVTVWVRGQLGGGPRCWEALVFTWRNSFAWSLALPGSRGRGPGRGGGSGSGHSWHTCAVRATLGSGGPPAQATAVGRPWPLKPQLIGGRHFCLSDEPCSLVGFGAGVRLPQAVSCSVGGLASAWPW